MISQPFPDTGFKKSSNCHQDEITLPANTPLKVLDANSNRVAAYFQNNSTKDITLVLGDEDAAMTSKGIVLKAKGGSFSITQINLYDGVICAISKNETFLTFVECKE